VKADLTLWLTGDETVTVNLGDVGFATLRIPLGDETITVHSIADGHERSPARRAANLDTFEQFARKVLAAVEAARTDGEVKS
jgi:alpha-D-ribose 1-methylphosphonate 5-triphosphate synthase subunit PhnG